MKERSTPTDAITDATTDATADATRPRPLLLEPVISRRLWGGERLSGYLQREAHDPDAAPEADPPGEAWLVYEGNRVRGGPHDGRTLGALAAEQGAELLGRAAVARYGARMPLLAKVIDAADRLSIQVHPDDAYALERERDSGHLGKAEAWYVLDAAPGAEIIWGVRRDLDADEVRRRVADGTLEEVVNRVPVAAGDVIYNAPGVIHAIGAGIFLFEIQQSSDLTYRLYDYNRRGADGELRELHLDKALEVAELGRRAPERSRPPLVTDDWQQLFASEHFVLERCELVGEPRRGATTPESLQILVLLRGDGELQAAGGHLRLCRGDALVLPAALGEYRVSGNGELVRCRLPESDPG